MWVYVGDKATKWNEAREAVRVKNRQGSGVHLTAHQEWRARVYRLPVPRP